MKTLNALLCTLILCICSFNTHAGLSATTGTTTSTPSIPHVAFIAGKASHLYGEHEFNAGGKIIVDALNASGLVSAILYRDGWPKDGFQNQPDALIFYMDGLEGHEALLHLEEIQSFAEQGVGIMAMHFAVHLPVGKGADAFSQWIGGYYESNYSTNPHWQASININNQPHGRHPVLNGVEPFQLQDELYFNIRFTPGAPNFTPLLTATPDDQARAHVPHAARKLMAFGGKPLAHITANKGKEETLAWSVENSISKGKSQRGLGFTGGHFHWNWVNPNYRKFVLNAVAWTAGADIPDKGIDSKAWTIDELWQGQDESPLPLINSKKKIIKKFAYSSASSTSSNPKSAISDAAFGPEGFFPQKMFTLPDDLEVELWAVSPQLYNPTNIDIDKDGRVWVAEGWNYRGMPNPREAGDRIVVLEDSNNDGKADQSHTFVQDPELLVPMGIAVLDNKIYVSQPPHLIVYTDVNRNLVFDKGIDTRENLLTGFEGRNHDHSLHSVTAGPDGWLYANTGNKGANIVDQSGNTYHFGSTYSNFENAGKASADGHVYIGGTAFRFPSDGSKVEVIGHNFRNSYEQSINSLGDVYQNDNDDFKGSRTSWLMEYGNMGYASNDGQHTWSESRRPEQNIATAHWHQDDPGVVPVGDVYGDGAPTGIVTYEGDALGEFYQGAVFSAESALNSIFLYKPEAQDAGFSLDNRSTLITSNPNKDFSGIDSDLLNTRFGPQLLQLSMFFQKNLSPNVIKFFERNAQNVGRWVGGLSFMKEAPIKEISPQMFRPADVAVGTEGAIYIADWFDPRVGGHSAKDSLRQGAIYRIVPKNKTLQKPAINTTSLEGAIEALKNPAINVRALGFYALKGIAENEQAETHQKEAALNALLALLQQSENPFIQSRVVWLLPHFGEAGLNETRQLLNSENSKRVITALRSLERQQKLDTDTLLKLSAHPSSAVRRELALKLRDRSWAESEATLIALANNLATDRWSIEALGIAAMGKETQLFESLKLTWPSDPIKWDQRAADISWRLHPASAIADLKQRALSTSLNAAQRQQAIDAIAAVIGDKKRIKNELTSIAKAISKQPLDKAPEKALLSHSKWWATNIENLKSKAAAKADDNSIALKTVLSLKGNAQQGEALLSSSPCLSCHTFNGKGGDMAPSLNGIAEKLTQEQIIKNMLKPISAIMPSAASIGYTEQNVADIARFLKKGM